MNFKSCGKTGMLQPQKASKYSREEVFLTTVKTFTADKLLLNTNTELCIAFALVCTPHEHILECTIMSKWIMCAFQSLNNMDPALLACWIHIVTFAPTVCSLCFKLANDKKGSREGFSLGGRLPSFSLDCFLVGNDTA